VCLGKKIKILLFKFLIMNIENVIIEAGKNLKTLLINYTEKD
jgi:hypothetical protein